MKRASIAVFLICAVPALYAQTPPAETAKPAAQEKPYKEGRHFIFRLNKGDDLLEKLTQFCADNRIETGVISGVGALDKAAFGYYEQNKKRYENKTLSGQFEILNLSGNISVKEGKPMAHAHITLAKTSGESFGGHLMPGSRVFACEIYIQELAGEPKVRRIDAATGLWLWSAADSRP